MGDELCLAFSRHSTLHSGQIITFLSHQITEYFALWSQSLSFLLSCVFFSEAPSVLPISHKAQIGEVLWRLVFLAGYQPRNTVVLSVVIVFMVTSLTKVLSRLFILVGRPALGRVWVVPYLRRPLCPWKISTLLKLFYTLPQIYASSQVYLRE
jgi:hypothetical protein